MNENGKKLYDGITHIDDELVEEAQAAPARRKSPWLKWGALAACLCLAVVGALTLLRPHSPVADPDNHAPSAPVTETGEIREPDPAFLAAKAEYPEALPYPKEEDFIGSDGTTDYDAWDEAYGRWREATQAAWEEQRSYTGALDDFLSGSIPTFLGGTPGQNRVYSPLNVYLALGMLAEVTDGNSRQQILDALGADSIDTLRTRAHALWSANYKDDGVTTSLLASSLWLRDDMGYIPATLQSLADHYYASSFRGTMGTDAYNQALRDWLNSQTGGLLRQQAEGVEMSEDTVLALATAIYYKAPWLDEFFDGANTTDTFHAPSGDRDVTFLHGSDTGILYQGEGFTAMGKALRGGTMWFLLPDKGKSPEKLLDGTFTDFLLADKGQWAQRGQYLIHLSLPKFDVSSDTDLRPGMKALGVTDVFDDDLSDFTPLTDEADQLSVSSAQHAARVKVDEEGVEAAAYTVIIVDANTAFIEIPEIDFTLDRPFLFAITGEDDLPLFVGVVNEP